MLEPDDRRLMLQAFVPPEGYVLSRAVGTSFSLDLMALMAAPLAFTFDDPEEDDGNLLESPLALLHALRKHSGLITIFCQAGQIKIPPVRQPFLAYVESSVVEVTAPKGGVFHPKVWLIRYTATGRPTRMRLICASRNMTFDRSWDAFVVLDGEVVERQNAIALNHPLGDFIEALPGMAVASLAPDVTASIVALSQEVRRASWDLPEDVDSIDFYPLGLAARTRRPIAADVAGRPILIVSPFVSDEALIQLASRSSEATLVSRPEELAKAKPESLKPFGDRIYALADEVGGESAEERGDVAELVGLHSKTFVIDDGWNTRVLIGSMNATNAAMNRNVEFLVELGGKKSKLGIEKLLSPPSTGALSFYSLLRRWAPPTVAPMLPLPDEINADKILQALHTALAATGWRAAVSAVEGGYALDVTPIGVLPDLTQAVLVAWPVSLPQEAAQAVLPGIPTRFLPLKVSELSGFVALELKITVGAVTKSLRFAITAALQGAPERRFEELLANSLSGSNQFMQFVEALLSTRAPRRTGTGGEPHGNGQGVAIPLRAANGAWLERILALIPTNPVAVRDMGRVVEEMRLSKDGALSVPPELASLWDAIKPIVDEAAK